jgi:Zn-finger nucleic acid-binding protein
MCPVCQQPLVAFELDGVEIDRCVRCEGLWLDAGELEWIAHMAHVPQGGLSEAASQAKGQRGSKGRCPRCRRRLRKVTLERPPGLEIDRCPQGDGLWFDRGEIEAFLAAFETGETGAVARFFRDFFGKGERWVPPPLSS